MKLSIIIPVYNVEKYLAKCLDSVLVGNQFKGQIICVNDGSTDGSATILDEYAKRYPNIAIITQKNAGLSAARNAGLKVATSEYVCFLDSDDYWQPNVLSDLLEQIDKEQLDVLRFDYQNVNERDEVYLPYKYPHQIDSQVGVVDGETYLNTRMGYTCYAVMYIMRREIVPLFTEGMHFEDVDWLPRMMLKAKRVASTQTVVYNYLIRQGSITQTQGIKKKIKKNVDDEMYIIGQYMKYLAQHPNIQWLHNMQCIMVVGVLTTIAREFYSERKEYIERLRDMKVFPLAIANQGRTYRRRARLINWFGVNVYCIAMQYR